MATEKEETKYFSGFQHSTPKAPVVCTREDCRRGIPIEGGQAVWKRCEVGGNTSQNNPKQPLNEECKKRSRMIVTSWSNAALPSVTEQDCTQSHAATARSTICTSISAVPTHSNQPKENAFRSRADLPVTKQEQRIAEAIVLPKFLGRPYKDPEFFFINTCEHKFKAGGILNKRWVLKAHDQLKGITLTWGNWYGEFTTHLNNKNSEQEDAEIFIRRKVEMYSRIAPEGTKAEGVNIITKLSSAIQIALQHLHATRVKELVERVSKAKLDYQDQKKADTQACLLPAHPIQTTENAKPARSEERKPLPKSLYCPERQPTLGLPHSAALTTRKRGLQNEKQAAGKCRHRDVECRGLLCNKRGNRMHAQTETRQFLQRAIVHQGVDHRRHLTPGTLAVHLSWLDQSPSDTMVKHGTRKPSLGHDQVNSLIPKYCHYPLQCNMPLQFTTGCWNWRVRLSNRDPGTDRKSLVSGCEIHHARCGLQLFCSTRCLVSCLPNTSVNTAGEVRHRRASLADERGIIQVKVCEVTWEFQITHAEFKASCDWCTHFMQRSDLALRIQTLLARQLLHNFTEKLNNLQQCKQHYYLLGQIGNADETTTIFFNMPNNTKLLDLVLMWRLATGAGAELGPWRAAGRNALESGVESQWYVTSLTEDICYRWLLLASVVVVVFLACHLVPLRWVCVIRQPHERRAGDKFPWLCVKPKPQLNRPDLYSVLLENAAAVRVASGNVALWRVAANFLDCNTTKITKDLSSFFGRISSGVTSKPNVVDGVGRVEFHDICLGSAGLLVPSLFLSLSCFLWTVYCFCCFKGFLINYMGIDGADSCAPECCNSCLRYRATFTVDWTDVFQAYCMLHNFVRNKDGSNFYDTLAFHVEVIPAYGVRGNNPCSKTHMAHWWFTVGCQAGKQLANSWYAPGTTAGPEVAPLTSNTLPIFGPGVVNTNQGIGERELESWRPSWMTTLFRTKLPLVAKHNLADPLPATLKAGHNVQPPPPPPHPRQMYKAAEEQLEVTSDIDDEVILILRPRGALGHTSSSVHAQVSQKTQFDRSHKKYTLHPNYYAWVQNRGRQKVLMHRYCVPFMVTDVLGDSTIRIQTNKSGTLKYDTQDKAMRDACASLLAVATLSDHYSAARVWRGNPWSPTSEPVPHLTDSTAVWFPPQGAVVSSAPARGMPGACAQPSPRRHRSMTTPEQRSGEPRMPTLACVPCPTDSRSARVLYPVSVGTSERAKVRSAAQGRGRTMHCLASHICCPSTYTTHTTPLRFSTTPVLNNKYIHFASDDQDLDKLHEWRNIEYITSAPSLQPCLTKYGFRWQLILQQPGWLLFNKGGGQCGGHQGAAHYKLKDQYEASSDIDDEGVLIIRPRGALGGTSSSVHSDHNFGLAVKRHTSSPGPACCGENHMLTRHLAAVTEDKPGEPTEDGQDHQARVAPEGILLPRRCHASPNTSAADLGPSSSCCSNSDKSVKGEISSPPRCSKHAHVIQHPSCTTWRCSIASNAAVTTRLVTQEQQQPHTHSPSRSVNNLHLRAARDTITLLPSACIAWGSIKLALNFYRLCAIFTAIPNQQVESAIVHYAFGVFSRRIYEELQSRIAFVVGRMALARGSIVMLSRCLQDVRKDACGRREKVHQNHKAWPLLQHVTSSARHPVPDQRRQRVGERTCTTAPPDVTAHAPPRQEGEETNMEKVMPTNLIAKYELGTTYCRCKRKTSPSINRVAINCDEVQPVENFSAYSEQPTKINEPQQNLGQTNTVFWSNQTRRTTLTTIAKMKHGNGVQQPVEKWQHREPGDRELHEKRGCSERHLTLHNDTCGCRYKQCNGVAVFSACPSTANCSTTAATFHAISTPITQLLSTAPVSASTSFTTFTDNNFNKFSHIEVAAN
ncbi:hypothetical protein PR048_013947 [Dryococelus australis]|uniref:Uncharacterized protein n=1 Tax=Dryococelus australis TaxID=614101 RepID=A0ABQ9HTM3_9NEOP|nr:hypothetical protein PR048_013947 [Dryococelus australis]